MIKNIERMNNEKYHSLKFLIFKLLNIFITKRTLIILKKLFQKDAKKLLK